MLQYVRLESVKVTRFSKVTRYNSDTCRLKGSAHVLVIYEIHE